MRREYFKPLLLPVISLALLTGSLFPASAFAALERQPYLQSISDTRVVLRWRTTSAASSRVSYGQGVGNLNTNVDDVSTATEHEVVITGLTPNTKYFYSVGATTGSIEAGNDADHYFTTAPNVGSNQKIRIWAIGDPGTGNNDQKNVRDALTNLDNKENIKTDLVLTLGDNAYDDGTDSEYTSNFFNIYKNLFRNTPVWSTRGNHERDQNLNVYTNAFTHPVNGESGGLPSGTELYYSFDYGNIHFVCLDSFTPSNLNGTTMYDWLEADLASTTQKWIIAYWHHPPYSRSSNGHDSDSEVGLKLTREKANPILEKYGVDLQLGGHNHFYSRTFFINNHYGLSNSYNSAAHAINAGDGRADGDGVYNKASNPEGAVYVLAGSSGKATHTPLHHPANYTEKRVLGSMVIDVDGERMDVRMLRDNGSIQDYFSITKTAFANQPPQVNAGFDQGAETGAVLNLNATVNDDGLPNSALTYSWSKISGPGSVSFGNASSVDTTVSFSTAGSYVLQLEASDSLLTGTDSVIITVTVAQNVDTDGDGIDNNTDTDDDNDGMPDVWELQYGFDPLDSADALLDADGDGVSNLQEFLQGSEPLPVHTGPMTLSFQDGVEPDASYAGTSDTVLSESQPDTNFGTSTSLFVDGDEPSGTSNDVSSMLSWDITAIPSGSVIESVEVTLEVTNITSGAYGVYQLLSPWNEAQATWNKSVSGASWQTGGASGSLDRASVELGAVSAGSLGSYSFSLNSSGLAVVQSWVDNPGANHGFIISDSSVTNGVDIISREAAVAVTRPKLTITYSSPLPASLDSDGDGLPDVWELQYGLNPLDPSDAALDADGDGYTNAEEYQMGTSPLPGPVSVSNQVPVVNAGPDLNTSSGTLNATVTDDGLPNDILTLNWSLVSGPGNVTFGDASALDTSVSFSVAGSYVLRLEASDGVLTASDEVTITVPEQTSQVNAGEEGAGAANIGLLISFSIIFLLRWLAHYRVFFFRQIMRTGSTKGTI